MIELKSSSLFGLLIICSIPLLYFVVIGLLARKRIIENEPIRKELRKGANNKLFDHKWMLLTGIMSGLLFFVFATLAGFLLIAYKNSISIQVVNWVYLSVITITFFCGGVVSVLLLIFKFRRNKSMDKNTFE